MPYASIARIQNIPNHISRLIRRWTIHGESNVLPGPRPRSFPDEQKGSSRQQLRQDPHDTAQIIGHSTQDATRQNLCGHRGRRCFASASVSYSRATNFVYLRIQGTTEGNSPAESTEACAKQVQLIALVAVVQHALSFQQTQFGCAPPCFCLALRTDAAMYAAYSAL